MAQITTNYAGGPGAYLKHTIQPTPDISGGYVKANAAAYEQYADLLHNIVASGDVDTVLTSMKIKNVSSVMDMFDRTETNFLNSLGSSQRLPNADLEFTYPVEDIEALQWRSAGSLSKVTATESSKYFRYGDGISVSNDTIGFSGTAGADKAVFKLTDLIPASDPMWRWMRKNMVLREADTNKRESIFVIDIGGTLYGLRGSQVQGIVQTGASVTKTCLPVDVTEEHAPGKVWICDQQLMNEFDYGSEMIEESYGHRTAYMGMLEFTTNITWLRKLLTAVHNPVIGDPVARAKERMQKRINEIWNRNAIFGTMGRINIDGKTYYRAGGILNDIRRYATEKWGGDHTLANGYFPEGVDTTNAANFVPYKCNGESNYRVGMPGDPSSPIVFSQAFMEELDYRYRMNLGVNNEHLMADTVYLSSDLYRIATQFDEGRVRTNIYQNAVSGYQSVQWLSPMGTLYKFVRDENFKNMVLVGNPKNGSREALVSLMAFDLTTHNPSEAKMYVSIQGFAWKRPEYLWFLWENVTAR